MTLELSQVTTLRKNKLFVADVGPLAPEGVRYLKTSTNMVRIIGSTLSHIFDRGRYISDFEIITMPFGLKHGLMIGELADPNCLIVNYIYVDTGIRYKVALKSANNNSEIWVSSMYRLRPRQTKPLLKRGVVIKNHSR